MKDVIDSFFRHKNEIGNVMLNKPEILIPSQMSDVRGLAGNQIVDGNDAMACGQ